jgi:hypothetical protein
MDVRTFVQKRNAAVTAQLDGKSPGKMPSPAMGPGGPGGPGGGNPAAMLVRPLLTAGDKNRDGKLSKEEIETAATALLSKWDKDGDGQLDDKELQSAIGSLIPAPQFGPPGGQPGGPNPGPPGRR